jgi:hypothetical protein
MKWIDLLHTAGFSLQEMREVLRSWWDADLGPAAMERLRALFEAKLAETRDAIQRQQRLERELVDGLEYLQTCRSCGVQETAVGCVHCGIDAGIKSRPERTSRPRSRRSAFVPLQDVDRPRERGA